jgi:hypothetical protein
MKYLKSFDRVNELFGFGKKEKPIDKNKEKEDRINYQKKMISRLFPESIYGSYFDRMEPETFYMLYKIVINFCESIDMGVPYKALIDVLESKGRYDEKRQK